MESTISITSTPYGHACVACARSKCRCIPRIGGGSCQRCHRLNKECRPTIRARKPKPLSKTAQLEQKVDGLMSLLKSTTAPAPNAGDDPGLLESHVRTRQIQGSTPQAICSQDSSVGDTVVSDEDEDEVLHAFITEKLPFFPFVHFPAGTSAQQLKHDSPFLWLCVTAVQAKSTARQAVLAVRIREMAAKKVLVECQKSLELLQGLLVYLAWVTYQSQPHKRSFCIYAQLAIALVVEMGLNHPPPQDTVPGLTHDAPLSDLPHLRPPTSPVRTMNERRAVLSCFVITSSIAHFIGRMDPLRWTCHMTNCLETLSRDYETENDAVLVQIARIRLITDKIVQWSSRDNSASESVPRAPSYFHLEAIKAQLEDLKASIPPHLLQNKPILFHLYHTDIGLYATALLKPSSGDEATDPRRLDNLYACLVTVKKFFDLLDTIPPAAYASFSVTHLTQISHSFITLFRLSVFDYPGWDRTAVRSMVDILSVAEKVDHQMELARDAIGIRNEGPEPDFFAALSAVLRKLKTGWATRLADLEAAEPDTLRGFSSHETGQGFFDSILAWPGDAWFTDSFFQGGDLNSNLV